MKIEALLLKCVAWLMGLKHENRTPFEVSLTGRLVSYASNKPYFHLPGYMGRWWVIRRPATEGEPGYGTFRNFLRRLYPRYVRLHDILTADAAEDMHNHPFTFTTLILLGGYTEERLMPTGEIRRFTHKQGDVVSVRSDEFHRIIDLNGTTLTLVVMSPSFQPWGFLRKGVFIPHEQYRAETTRV